MRLINSVNKIKNSAKQPVPMVVELYEILRKRTASAPIIFLYTDGGSGHHHAYILMQISMICSFLKVDLAYLGEARTAPYHSWCNPIE